MARATTKLGQLVNASLEPHSTMLTERTPQRIKCNAVSIGALIGPETSVLRS